MQIWVQVYGLSLDMQNKENARSIGNSLGRCIRTEEDNTAKNQTFLRIQVEVNVEVYLVEGFWWTSRSGEEKWATVKYERLSDICYGCGKLGHTSLNYEEGVAISEINPDLPKYGSWLSGTRSRMQTKWYQLGGERQAENQRRGQSKRTWKDVMNSAAGKQRRETSSRENHPTRSTTEQWRRNEGAHDREMSQFVMQVLPELVQMEVSMNKEGTTNPEKDRLGKIRSFDLNNAPEEENQPTVGMTLFPDLGNNFV